MAEAEERQRVASLSALTPRKPPSLAAALAAAAAEPGSPKSGSDATTSVAAHPAALSAAPVVCKVTMKHVLQATSAIFGSPNANRIKALNMHHKLVLCALVVMKQHAVADFTVAKVYEVYLALAKNGSMVAPVHRTEFNDLVMTLETQGLVHLHSRRKVDDLANKTASLIVRASDVEQAVSSVPVLATLLKDAKTVLQNAKIV
nr:AAA ATPase [Polyrhizophydium stewartii]